MVVCNCSLLTKSDLDWIFVGQLSRSTSCVHLIHIHRGHLKMETFHPKVSFDLKEIHLAHGHLEQSKAELLGALYGTKEEREGGDSTTGVPENWLPP